MENITRMVKVSIQLKPEEVAALFCSMGEQQQSSFFNEIARLSNLWPLPFCMQLQYITDCPLLSDEARWVMEQIGRYAYQENKP